MRLKEIQVGDIVKHFKREWVDGHSSMYLYKVLAFAQHSETGEMLVIYQAMYCLLYTSDAADEENLV